MTEKAQLEEKSNYFTSPKTHLEFIHSGCVTLDCVLGGGYPLGRISNIVGDKSAGKTLTGIEACANFAVQFPDGQIHYREAEAAFDQHYAAALGMPIEKVDFGPADFFTVEDFFEDLTKTVDVLTKKKQPGLYIVDSLDALSDRDEQDRDIDKGTYGATKAKKLSELFRRMVKKVEASRVHLMIISQVRDNFNAGPFGPKNVRSGGRALDFYASQILYLTHIAANATQQNGVKRITGITVRAKCTKNKIGLPLREAEFEIGFGVGIDRLNSAIEWLKEVKRLDVLGGEAGIKQYLKNLDEMPDTEYWLEVREIEQKVKQTWKEIEQGFLPTRQKSVYAAG